MPRLAHTLWRVDITDPRGFGGGSQTYEHLPHARRKAARARAEGCTVVVYRAHLEWERVNDE